MSGSVGVSWRGYEDGTTGPGLGIAFAVSDLRIDARLGNLTGSGPPTPPAQVLLAPFTGSYSYNLTTAIDNPLLDAASSSVLMQVRVGGVTPAGWQDVIANCNGNCNSIGGGNFSFNAILPPNSVTPLTVTIDPLDFASTSEGPLSVSGDVTSVFEGADGAATFTVTNFGGAATVNSLSVTQLATLGDASDWANISGIGGTCLVGNILAAAGECTVIVNYVTDLPDEGPLFDGWTPFQLDVGLDDGRTGDALALAIVSDVPEPTTLALLGVGLFGFGAFRFGSARRKRG